MAVISGHLKYDALRSAVSSPSLPGIAGVPIVLQNIQTNQMLAVLTNADGSYTFNNVPDGSYRIVEAYGIPASASPGDFSRAVAGSPVTSTFPPLSFVTNPPAGATNLDATTPTTLLVTVSGSNLVNQDILNGPVKYTPIHTILDTGVSILPGNLITKAANGTFGSFPQGTPANTGANPNPYPDIGSSLFYTQPNPIGVNPGGGQYTIQNILNNATAAVQGSWWRVADHTTGNETGRMMVINGNFPGEVIFEQKITVKPNTFYLMSSWIMNLSKSAALVDPQLGVQIVDSRGNILYNATLGALIPDNPNYPEWKQIGTVFNSQSNTSLTIRFTSNGPETVGNDYVIDDIAVNEVQVTAYTPVKSANPTVTHVGDVVTYTISLKNTGINPLTNLFIQDTVPNGLRFIPGTVTVNGSVNASADPNTGFTVGSLPAGSTLTVTFQATAEFIPAVNPTANTANASYSYSPVAGGIPSIYPKKSNTANVEVRNPHADLMVTKTGNQNPVSAGSVLTYTVPVINNGPNAARDVILTDAVPPGLLNPEYSTDGGVTWQPWTGKLSLDRLSPREEANILIRGTVNSQASGTLTNAASVSSSTNDPNPDNNSATVITQINTQADLAITKTGTPEPVQTGDTVTYTLTAENKGPNTASNVTITDNTPTDLLNPEYSPDGGVTWLPWNGTLSVNSLAAGNSVSILIRGAVSGNTSDILANTSTVSSKTPDPNPDNNSSAIISHLVNSADLSIEKQADKTQVLPGDTLTYTLTVRNSGPNTAQNITVTDATGGGLLAPEYSVDGGITWQPWTGSLTTDSLAPGSQTGILIRGTVSSLASGVLTNTAAVSSTTKDPVPDNNSDTVITPIISLADLAITKTGDHSPIQSGNVLTYTLTASNAGPGAANNVTITDTIPATVLSPEYSTDGGVTWQPWTGTYNAGTLASGASVSILIRGNVNPAAAGLITNHAVVSSSTPDPNPDNNTADLVTPINSSADLTISKTVDQSLVQPGNVLVYTLTALNRGPNDAVNAELHDTVSADLLNPEYSTDGGITWQPWTGTYALNTMPPGARSSILIRGTVNPAATGVITNIADVTSQTPDPIQRNNHVTVHTPINTSADLSIQKTTEQSTVQAGDLITYSLSAVNNGPNAAENAVIRDPVPPELQTPEYSLDNGVTWQPYNGSLIVGTIPANSSVTVLIRGRVGSNTPGTLQNTASINSTTPDPNPDNNESTTVLTPITTSADLSMSKTADKSPVKTGDVLTYTLTAANNGPNDARDVTVFDNTPLSLQNTEYSTDGGITWKQWRGAFTFADIPAGSSKSILIRGTVTATEGTIANTATVSSPVPDPDSHNNSSTVLTPVENLADLSITKTDSQNPVSTGDVLIYHLTAANSGPNAANNVVITDTVSNNFLTPEFSTDGGITWQPWTGSYQAGTLPAGSGVSILIRGTVSNTNEELLTNTAAVSSTTQDPNTGNNSDTAITFIQKKADLAIDKTADKSPVETGDVLTYHLTVTNHGPDAANNVTVFDHVPPVLNNPEYSTDGGVTWKQWRGGLTLAGLDKDASAQILIRGTAGSSSSGTITNTATVSSPTLDPDPDNNSDTTLTPIKSLADLAVTKTPDKSPVNAGERITYILTGKNSGPDAANDVTITDTIPENLLNPEYSTDGGMTWLPWNGAFKAGTLTSGASVTIQIRATVDPANTEGVTNTAGITGSTQDPNTANNQDTSFVPLIPAVTPPPDTGGNCADLSVHKSANANCIYSGETLYYTLTVTNLGPDKAENIVLSDTDAKLLIDPEYSPDNGVTWLPWNGSLHIPELSSGEQSWIFIRGTFRSRSSCILCNEASVTSSTNDPDPSNNRAKVNTQILCRSPFSRC